MGQKFEFEKVEDPTSGLVSTLVSAVTDGEQASTCWKCTVYDDETGQEVADGLGNTREEAKWEAQAKL